MKLNKSLKPLKMIVISFILLIWTPVFALSQDAYEEDDNFEKAHTIDKPQHHDFHDAGDADWIKFYGIPGETYTIKADNMEASCNAVIELYKSGGTTLVTEENDGEAGEDQVMKWNCSIEGMYFVKVRNHDSDIFGDNTGYWLHFQRYDAYEEDDNFFQARIIDKLQHHNFHDAGDADWIKFYGIPGETYIIKTINLESECKTVIELYEVDGITPMIKKDGGEAGKDQIMEWNCPSEGIYYVKITHSNPNTFGENTEYDLYIEYPQGYDAYEEDDTFEQARNIVIHERFQHHNFHDIGDLDWVKFYGIAGQEYVIETTNLGSECNAVIELYDTDGLTMLKDKNEKGPGGEEYLYWDECIKDGIYYVKVKNLIFGENTGYDLRVKYSIAELPGIIDGYVSDICSKEPIANGIVKTNTGRSAITFKAGHYRMILRDDNHTLIVEAEGYENYSTEIDIIKMHVVYYDIEMSPLDLCTITMILKTLTGQENDCNLDLLTRCCLDANCDEKVELKDAIYLLQKVSGIRDKSDDCGVNKKSVF